MPRIRRDEGEKYPVVFVVPWCMWENSKFAYQEFGTEENLLGLDNPKTWLASSTSHPKLSTSFAMHASTGTLLIQITLQSCGRTKNRTIRNKNALPTEHTNFFTWKTENTFLQFICCGKNVWKMWRELFLNCAQKSKGNNGKPTYIISLRMGDLFFFSLASRLWTFWG